MLIASAAVAGCGVIMDDPEGYCRGITENYNVAWSMVGEPANVVVEVYGKPSNAKPRGNGYTELMFEKRGRIYQNHPTHFIVGPDGRVISWHDPDMASHEACEAWRKSYCPQAPECPKDDPFRSKQ
jgi:hypothetical protein